MSSDQMNSLPVKDRELSPQEAKVLAAMYQSNTPGTTDPKAPAPKSSVLKYILSGAVFFVLSMPSVDQLLKSKITASDTMILAIKTGIFLLILLILNLMGW